MKDMDALYEDVIDNLADGVVAVDRAFRVVVFNQAAEKITELSRTQALGRAAGEVFKRDPWLVEMLEKTLGSGRPFSEYEERVHRKFSSPLPVGVATSQVFNSRGELTGSVALIKDLSGIKSLEAGTLRKERLAYIGTFAANLAHEIKNPLTGISGAAQLLRRRMKDKDLLAYTEVIIQESDRLNTILRELLNFTRPARLKPRGINIHRVLDSVIMLIEQAEGPVSIAKEYDPSLPPVYGDEGQLTQVFLNLIKNAREACCERPAGLIRVITRMVTDFHLIDEGTRTRRGPAGAVSGKMAALEIRDNGCGIEPADIEKIFTPFFTTKPGGSGLGMAISLKIIKEHNGFLKIDSKPRQGTSVVVYLPIEERKAQGEDEG